MGYFLKQTIRKPPFKKLAVCRMVITFNSTVFSPAPGADDIHALKLLPSLYAFDFLPPQGAGVFAL